MVHMMITEQDRATARRVIRRHVGVSDGVPVHVRRKPCVASYLPGRDVYVVREFFDAACEAAALGRAYGKALKAAS